LVSPTTIPERRSVAEMVPGGLAPRLPTVPPPEQGIGNLSGSDSGSVSTSHGLAAILRALRPIVAHGGSVANGTELPLERRPALAELPSVSACLSIELAGARAIDRHCEPGVSAFLDGIQRSQLLGHVAGSPLVLGTVAAVVRVRVNKRLETWRAPRHTRAIFAARAQLGDALWAQLEALPLPIVDITESLPPDAVSPHPMAIRARALEVIAAERETAERRLAAEWCANEARWLWIDGGIAGNLAIDERATAFGVVKSHNTLYGDATAVRDVLALAFGERSPAFLVGHRPRRAVASWYLRVHAADSDPLHGLVRVEIAPPTVRDAMPLDGDAFSAHIDRLSAWILAERAPVSLPDRRWDTLTYGVYACEQYLKSIVGS
jgi:hypothetical protein